MKKTKDHTVKKILAATILVLLFLPLIQGAFHPISIDKLHRVSPTVEKPSFSIGSYLSANYQSQEEKYFNENFGFRNTAVRLDNQIAYWLFKDARAKGVIVGKNNYLYEEKYINSYVKKHSQDKKYISSKTKKIKRIQDTLATLGIDLIMVIAPGKGMYYPEYIPDRYYKNELTTNNYIYYLEEFQRENLNLIDANGWFLTMKDKAKYPLLPKLGIHWSRYGELLAADSIISYIEDKRDVKLPRFVWDEVELTKDSKFTDNDLEKGMNLLFKIPNIEMAYPKISIDSTASTANIKLLTIGDSFFWGMYYIGLPDQIFKNGEFWYYNKKIHSKNLSTPKSVEEIDLQQEVESNQVIMIMSTEANLSGVGWGFIENLYQIYFPD